MKNNMFDLSGPTADLTFLFPECKPSRNNRKGVCFLIVLQGEAFIEVDGRTYTLCKGALLSLTPGHLLLKHSHSQDFLCEYLLFEYDFLSDFPLLLKADVSIPDGGDISLSRKHELTDGFFYHQRSQTLIEIYREKCDRDFRRTTTPQLFFFCPLFQETHRRVSTTIQERRKIKAEVSKQDTIHASALDALTHCHFVLQAGASILIGEPS